MRPNMLAALHVAHVVERCGLRVRGKRNFAGAGRATAKDKSKSFWDRCGTGSISGKFLTTWWRLLVKSTSVLFIVTFGR